MSRIGIPCWHHGVPVMARALTKSSQGGDRWYGLDGVVLDADTNAACNILQRLYDDGITLDTPYREVKRLLRVRSGTPDGTAHPGLEPARQLALPRPAESEWPEPCESRPCRKKGTGDSMSARLELMERITVRQDVFGGKPIIRDLRIAVEQVLGMLAAGDTAETILHEYPFLEPEDIQACLLYAHCSVAGEDVHDRISVSGP